MASSDNLARDYSPELNEERLVELVTQIKVV